MAKKEQFINETGFAKAETLIPDDKNPIRHDEKNIREIMRSLDEFGQHAPLVVQKESNRVIVGNARLEAAKRLGWEKVWVVYVDDDDITAIRRGIADNKTGELSEWNDAALKLLLEDLAGNSAADIPGFDPEEIDREIEKHYDIEVGYCSMADINDWDMVLVSLTSPLEVYTLVQTFAKHGLTADSVRPAVVIGGAGNLNCKTYLEYGDYFVFGRGENVIVNVVENYLNPSHSLPNSVFKRGESSFDDIYTVAQADHLYPEAIGKARETMLGCPNKCRFCLYTYTRKYVGGGEYRDTGFYKGSDEVLLKDLDVRQGKSLVSSIDGFSERLRLAFSKPVTDKLIRQKLIEASEARTGDNIRMKLYQIMALPTETDEERKAFIEFLKDIDKECEPGRIIVMFVCTPFNADPLTPAQYSPVDVSREWRDELASWAKAEGYVFRGQALEVYFNPQATPSILTNLKYMIVHRGGVDDAKLVRAIALDPAFKKIRSYAAVKNIMNKYPKAEKFVRQYDIGDRGEWGYLVSYHTREQIDEDARRLHAALGLN